MAYNINKYNSVLIGSIEDGTINTQLSSLKLVGFGVPNYGSVWAENFIHVTENFARTTPPANPMIGQMWYHLNANGTGNHVMKVCKNNSIVPAEWVVMGGVTSSDSGTTGLPNSPTDGDLHWDGAHLYIYVDADTTWKQIVLTQNLGGTEVVFQNITITDTVQGDLTVTGTLTGNGSGVTQLNASNISSGTVPDSAITGAYTGITDLTASGTITGGTIVSNTVRPTANNTGSLGTSTHRYDNIYVNNLRGNGTIHGNWTLASGATLESTYADLAEKYQADCKLESGDVVVIGGRKEITKSRKEKDTDVFGVVSVNPALKLNSNDKNDYYYIALTGRVPVKCVGTVKKGQRLVTSGINGVAIALSDSDLKNLAGVSFMVIGRALENKETPEEGMVEIVVGKM